ncbi:class I SAM-dependent methyltransferase [Nonomuraea sp. H19]|uniref:class I SAM-dependent methyltransferase n=1 Tax=Nonomuraea sp. H19 TaxID=3452206 RepID=UPI003F8BFDC5
MLAAFAEFVRAGGAGRVAELGCGTGRVAAHLRDLELDVLGVDLSPVMIDLDRQAHPDLRFEKVASAYRWPIDEPLGVLPDLAAHE